MWLDAINLLSILVLNSLIGQNIASVFLTFGKKSARAEHVRLKSTNVHRGIMISLTAEQKYKICQDIFSTQFYMTSEAATETGVQRHVQHSIIVTDRWVTQEEVNAGVKNKADIRSESVLEEAGIVLVCVAMGFESRSPPKVLHYISPTFRTKWYYIAQIYIGVETPLTQYVTNFVVLSPDYVTFDQAELEKRYWNTRKIIATLREESREYVELIERRDNLSTLSKNQKLNVCAGILSSPVYRRDRLEYSVEWINEMNKEVVLDYKEVEISFDGLEEKLKTESILCKAFENGENLESPTTNMYLTRSYANGYSLIVLKEKNGEIFVDKYFKNIAELITVQEKMNSDKLFLNVQNKIKDDSVTK